MTETLSPIELDEDDKAELPAESELPAGFVIGGKYVVKRRLGMGATGAVYEGEHTGIGHRVAIKVVHRSLAARDDIISRFQLEAKICGTIRDRHVGQVYDVGTLEGGAPYMVMELHEGGSLGNLLDVSKLSIATIVDIARQLLAGLAAAHRANAVHRDVKPDNIMLVRESNGATIVKLVDFGISKNVQADISERGVTREGTVVGSVDYMSPEQLRGESVDLRADLYAVGVVLYEAITGRTPFDAPNITELVVAIMRDPVPPPTSLRADCPPQLEKVVQQAMSRKRDQRYASADAMSQALAEVQNSVTLATTVEPDAVNREQRAARTSEGVTQTRRRETPATGISEPRVPTAELQLPRKRISASSAGIAIGLVVAGALWLLWPREQTITTDRTSIQTKAKRAPVENEASKTPAAEPEANAPTPTQAPAALPDEPAPSVEPAVVAQVDDSVARKPTRPRSGPTQPEIHAQPETETPRPAPVRIVPAPAQPQDTQAMLKEANAAFVLGQMPRARALYQRVVTLAPSQADAWRGLGMVSSRMGQRSDAVRALQRYLQLRPSAPDAARIREQLDKLK